VKTRDFSFDLPPELIAQQPAADRSSARLLVLDRASGGVQHSVVRELARWVEPGTLVVFNDTRVRRARLLAGRGELLLLERLDGRTWRVLRRGRGKLVELPDGVTATVDGEVARFDPPIDEAWIERHGHVPLPPYIRRADNPSDAERYQTVFARQLGSAAAPTAGLHFTPELLAGLEAAGARLAWVTLHVGLGTFLPIRSEEVEDHPMHEESYSVPARTAAEAGSALAEGRPVLAVGTTVVRTLESAWDGAGLRAGEGRTRLFIRPGSRFNVVSMLFTNFHTPESSLLVLVSAFAGRERILDAYRQAVAARYRFFSYGDAMLIR
jgi:S-adenosylmethionine:tRNA ribosyltransferase-isomerase